jgi:hypothetical protein
MDRAAEAGIVFHCINSPQAIPAWLPEIGKYLHDPFQGIARAALIAQQRGLPLSPETLRAIACKEHGLEEGAFTAGWCDAVGHDARYMAKDPERCRRAILADHEREFRRLGLVRLERAMGDTEQYRTELEGILEGLKAASPALELPPVESAEDLEGETVDAALSVLGGGLLPVTGLAFIHASSGIGKTLFALQLSACVALGRPFFRWDTFPRRVLYLQGELSRVWWQTRSRALRAFVGAPLHDVFFCHESFPLMQYNRKDWSYSAFGLRKLRALIETHRAELVVVDPLSGYYELEENSTDQNREFQKRLLELRRDTGVTIILVHHDRKPGEGIGNIMRGSSVLRDYADLSISIRRKPKGTPGEMLVTFDKVRHGRNPGGFVLLQGMSGFFTMKEPKRRKQDGEADWVPAGAEDDDVESVEPEIARVESAEPEALPGVHEEVHEGVEEEEQGGEDGGKAWAAEGEW